MSATLQGRELVVLREGRRIVDGASILVRPGEAVAIQGPSGSGKSTLARALATLIEPDAGTVLLDGHDAREIAPTQFRTRVAFLAQQPAMFPVTVHAAGRGTQREYETAWARSRAHRGRRAARSRHPARSASRARGRACSCRCPTDPGWRRPRRAAPGSRRRRRSCGLRAAPPTLGPAASHSWSRHLTYRDITRGTDPTGDRLASTSAGNQSPAGWRRTMLRWSGGSDATRLSRGERGVRSDSRTGQ